MSPYREPESVEDIAATVAPLPLAWRIKRVVAYMVLGVLAEAVLSLVVFAGAVGDERLTLRLMVAVLAAIHAAVMAGYLLVALVRWAIRTVAEGSPT